LLLKEYLAFSFDTSKNNFLRYRIMGAFPFVERIEMLSVKGCRQYAIL